MADEVTIFRGPARWTLAELAKMAAEPLRRAGAVRAVAFGSYARGTADAYSDLDLAVIMDTQEPPLDRPRRLGELLDVLPVPVDLLVYTPGEFAQGLEGRRGMFATIAETGVPFYAWTPGQAFSAEQSSRAIDFASAIVDATAEILPG